MQCFDSSAWALLQEFFIPCSFYFLSIFTLFYLLCSSVCLIPLFLTTLVHEFYSHSECNLLFALSWDVFYFGWGALLNSTL